METQIFYWTGVAIWWVVLGSFVLAAVLLGVCLPFIMFVRVRKQIWKWLWAAKIAKYGLSQWEIAAIYRMSRVYLPEGVEVDDLVTWAGKVKEGADLLTKRKEKQKTWKT